MFLLALLVAAGALLSTSSAQTVVPQGLDCAVAEIKDGARLKVITLTCATRKVAPNITCDFYQMTDGGKPMYMKGNIRYSIIPRQDQTVEATCVLFTSPSVIGEGYHLFQAHVYPGVPDGMSLVNRTQVDGAVHLYRATVKHACPDTFIDDYLCGKPSFCNCTVVKQGWPLAAPMWFDGDKLVPSPSLMVLYDNNRPDREFNCASSSALGRIPSSTMTVEIDTSCA